MQIIKSNITERSDIILSCSIFSGITDKEAKAISDFVILREFSANEYLFLQEDPAEGFYIINKGKVKIHRTGTDGREQVLHIMGKGEPCGEVPVFQGKHYPASAMALDKVRALFVPADRFIALSREYPDILIEMLAELSVRLRRFVNLIDDLSLKEVSARLAKHILDLKVREGGNMIELDSTKTVLASRLGTISETISRTLKKMQNKGIIEVKGSTIKVIDEELLIELSAGFKL
jgi:CRP/FNR family transcriptional regulator, dissimilatory nitrate respiration regulator